MRIIERQIKIIGLVFFLLISFSYCNSESPGKARPVVHTVEILQMKFIPAELIIGKGGKVVFINKDFVDHNITEQSNKTWSSSPLKPDDSWSVIIKENTNY